MAYKRVSGVYEIRNTLNSKVYVGSSINTSRRLKDHARKLAKGEHESQHLQASWNKYGAEAFKIKLLLVCSPENVLFYEQLVADGFQANEKNFGYNKRVVVATCAGMKKTDEQKARLRECARRGPDHHYFGRRLSDAAHAASIDAKSEVIRTMATTNDARARQYSATMSGYQTVVQALGQVASTKLENQRQEIVAFQAQLQAQVAQAQVANEYYRSTSTVGIANAELQMKAMLGEISSRRDYGAAIAELGASNAKTYASMAGAAMAGMNTLVAQSESQ